MACPHRRPVEEVERFLAGGRPVVRVQAVHQAVGFTITVPIEA
jgi:hypothetical protein